MRRPVLLLALGSLVPLASSASGGALSDPVVVRPSCFEHVVDSTLAPLVAVPKVPAQVQAPPPASIRYRERTEVDYESNDVPDSSGSVGAPSEDVGGWEREEDRRQGSGKRNKNKRDKLAEVSAERTESSAEGAPVGHATGNDEVATGAGGPLGEELSAVREDRAEPTPDPDIPVSEKARSEAPWNGADARGDDGSNVRGAFQQALEPVLDWGAKIFLSNDDSMSLASAQRVIYALQRSLALPLEHIRPHELLNYFSFDVSHPDPDQLFDVTASAEQQGDDLAVAFAVAGAVPARQPLDLTLVLDRSCSMADEGRMAYTHRGLLKMGERLEDGDRVDVVLFDDAVCTPLENWVVGRDDPALLAWAVQNAVPTGATNLDLGLRTGYALARAKRDTHRRNRRVMLLTDAELNTGDVDPHTVSEIGTAFDEQGIRLTGVGVGRTFRDDVLDRLTEKGRGAYVFLGSDAVVDRVFGTGFDSLVRTIAHDVRFELDLPDGLALERFYGEESSTDVADIQPIHYYAGTSQLFLQDLKIRDGRLRPGETIRLTIAYRDAATGEPQRRTFGVSVRDLVASDRHNVRKAKALMAWTDLLELRAMGADACGAPLARYAGLAGLLSDDAEIAFVNGLVRGVCGDFDLPEAVAAAPLKVRVDSDQPISSVGVRCGSWSAREALRAADTVARFDAQPGSCRVTLGGVVDLNVDVEVPETGRDLRCTVRAGRVRCG